jgi:integrase
VDFEKNRIRITSKEVSNSICGWEPKEHEGRVLPVPAEMTQLLADLHAVCPEGYPYVFIPDWRWKHIRQAQKDGKWNNEQKLLNNPYRRFNTLRKRAGVTKCTLHDFRRSCITNWAKEFSIYVVQKLAGHSDKTTGLYYLAAEESDMERAKKIQDVITMVLQIDKLPSHDEIVMRESRSLNSEKLLETLPNRDLLAFAKRDIIEDTCRIGRLTKEIAKKTQ